MREKMKTSEFRKQYAKYKKANNSGPKVPPKEKHRTHQIEVRPGVGPHLAQYWCVTCNKWVDWLNKKDAQTAIELGMLK